MHAAIFAMLVLVATGLLGVAFLVWLVWQKLVWLINVVVPWMNGISQHVGDDRPPIQAPPVKG